MHGRKYSIIISLAMADKIVHLGTARTPTNKHELKPENFPSMLGESPVWVAKPPTSLNCGSCEKPMVFMLQVYAPIDGNEETYHRMIYVFACAKPKCARSGKEVLVLRWQAGEEFKAAGAASKEEGKKMHAVKAAAVRKGKGEKVYVVDVVSEESEVTEVYIEKTRSIIARKCKYDAYEGIEEQKNKNATEDLEEIKERLLCDESGKGFEHENKLWKSYLEKEQLPEEAELESVPFAQELGRSRVS